MRQTCVLPSPWEALAMRVAGGNLYLLDQRLLPHQEEWLLIETEAQMASAIHNLQVRGAPLIAVACAAFVAVRAAQGVRPSELLGLMDRLVQTRPTAVNLSHAMTQLKSYLQAIGANTEDTDWRSALVKQCHSYFVADAELCERMARYGAELISDGDQILTHCNTGGLATAGRGTALAVIAEAHRVNTKIHVWVDETRPLLQGGRLTAWELKKLAIPHRLICDNMAGALMSQGRVTKVFVGADRIAANGDFANKIGTYSLAVLAHFHRIPFYVVAPTTTFDQNCATGRDIPIEERAAQEVRGIQFAGLESSRSSSQMSLMEWAPVDTPVLNPAFDVTPNELVTAWISEEGITY